MKYNNFLPFETMKYFWPEFETILFIWLFCCNIEVNSKSIKIRTAKPKINAAKQKIYYPGVKVHRPVTSTIVAQRKSDVTRQSETGVFQTSNEISQDPIQTTFNTGFRGVFEYMQKLVSRYLDPAGDNETPTNTGALRIPGFPTTPIFHSLDVSSIVKLLEATDGSQVEVLAEAAVVDIVSQLVSIIGFNDLRDWLGIVLMYFILGPILIPLFWLPISLFGMAGLLAPLFFFNPPSKPNVDVMGHDPILPEEGKALSHEKNSLEMFLFNMFKNSLASKQFSLSSSSAPSLIESCMERVSCHFTRFYRENPISKWLTSHFNATKVEWARVHPEGDINENGISSWEDCKKYVCSVFPAA